MAQVNGWKRGISLVRVKTHHAKFGVALFFVYMLIPFRLQEALQVVRLHKPHQIALFGTAVPYVTVVDITLAIFVLIAFLRRRIRIRKNDFCFLFYITMLIVSFLWVAVEGTLNPSRPIYLDSVIEIIRLSSIYLLFVYLMQSGVDSAFLLQSSLVLIMLPTIFLRIAGYSNPRIQYDQSGRLNAIGLETNSTAYMSAVLLYSGFISRRITWALIVIAVGGAVLFITGVRGVLFISAATSVVLLLGKTAIRKRFASSLVLVVLIVLILMASGANYQGLPTFRRLSWDLTVASYTIPEAFHYSFVLREQLGPVGEILGDVPSVLGRVWAWDTGLQVFHDRPHGLLASDWHVQEELVNLGYPSHSHNTFLQMYLRFGPIIIVFWVLVLRSVGNGLLRRSPYAYILLLLVIGWFMDYWFYVTKAAFIFLALVRLNEHRITLFRHRGGKTKDVYWWSQPPTIPMTTKRS